MIGDDATGNYQSLGYTPSRHSFHHRGAGGSALLIVNTRRTLFQQGYPGVIQYDTPTIGIDSPPNCTMAFANWIVVTT